VFFAVLVVATLSSCLSVRLIGVRPGLGADNAMGYFMTDAAQSKGAVCIDGTPGAYYLKPGTGDGARKWYIHHEGGGWCSSYADCYARSLTDLGSSAKFPKTINLDGGYFSSDPTINPQMYNWNMVYLMYCDGGSFSGNNQTVYNYQGHPLHFRGFRLLQAFHADLFTNRGLRTATDAVISGCSAGGLATFLHVDWWKENLSPTTRVVGMPDSGFFLDYEAPGKRYHSAMMWTYYTMAAQAGVNQDCVRAFLPRDDWRCFFAQHTAPFIKTPIFPLQAKYDSWQTSEDLNSNNPVLINEWGTNLTRLVESSLLKLRPDSGIFLDSCFHHCGEWGDIVIDGRTQATAFAQWYQNRERNKYYNQKGDYPCTACCHP